MYDALLDDDNATRTRVAPQRFEDVVASNAEVTDDDTAPREASAPKAPAVAAGEGLATGMELDSWSDDPVRMYLTQMGEIPLLTRCEDCLLYTSPSPRDATLSRMPSSA